MTLSSTFNRCLILAALVSGQAGTLTTAAPPTAWARSYRAPEGVPSWLEGGLALGTGGTDYWLYAFGDAPKGSTSSGGSQALVHLDENGKPDWGTWAVEGSMGYTSLEAAHGDGVVFAKIEGLAEEDYWTVFGMFNGADGSRLFERGVRVAVAHPPSGYIPDPSVAVDQLRDGRVFVRLNHGDLRTDVAVLDPSGQIQWQRTFTIPSLALSGSGPNSDLIEDSDQGFWLIIRGSRALSTQPNPPVYNDEFILNVIRLGNDGSVIGSSRITGLTTSEFLPGLGAPAFAPDGSLLLSITDSIKKSPLDPTPGSFSSSFFLLNPDGQLRWARRIGNVAGTGLAPYWTPDGSAFFLVGAKLRSLTPLSADGLLVKLDAASGDLLAQTAVNLSNLDELTVSGVTGTRVYVHELEAHVPASPSTVQPSTSFIGYYDLNLTNATWQRASDSIRQAALFSNGAGRGFTYTRFLAGDSRIDGLQLDADLNLLPGQGSDCESFAPVNVPSLNPNMTVERLNLAQGQLDLTVTNATIDLAPTSRIQLQSLTPFVEDICQNPSFRLGVPALQSGMLQVPVSITPNQAVQVEASADLVHWSPLLRLTNTAEQAVFSDILTNVPRRYYRAVVPR